MGLTLPRQKDKNTKTQKHKKTKGQKDNKKTSFSLLEKWGSLSPLPTCSSPETKICIWRRLHRHYIAFHYTHHYIRYICYTQSLHYIAFHYTHHYIAHIAHITCVTSFINRHFFTPTITAHTLHTLHLLYTGITLHLITPTLQHTRYNRTKS